MEFTTWPQVNMINQKNYYTEFLKQDDQALAVRLQQEERLNARKKAAVDIDRARAQAAQDGVPYAERDADLDDDVAMDDADGEDYGSKTIVIHIGSQNMRIGLATDALPKTIPMVIAKRSTRSESEDSEPLPKRVKLDGPSEEWFGEEFAREYNTMAQDFKTMRRHNKRRVLPNSRELVTKWNSATPPEMIPEHSDPMRIDWTELPDNAKAAQDHIVGHAALRIPEKSKPRYRLFWPIQHGWLNEKDYNNRNMLEHDFFLIIEDSIRNELGLNHKREWAQYSCVFIIPDLYEKVMVTRVLDELLRDFSFQRVCFIQESLAATFGAGVGAACMVDMGAQKTSISCVEDGMIIEDSRINLKYGGYDVTEAFVRMMLFDRFHYSDFNLMRRHDYLLAEELKAQFTTMSDEDISVKLFDFHLRAHGQQTRKYNFKIYDESMLAPLGFFRPTIFDQSRKLIGRHTIMPRSVDLYNGRPNDPLSKAQIAVYTFVNQFIPSAVSAPPAQSAQFLSTSTPVRRPLALPSHLNGDTDGTPRSSPAGSPAPEDGSTPHPTGDDANGDDIAEIKDIQPDTDVIDRAVPIMPLEQAILISIQHAAGTGPESERRRRDLLGSIMCIGGASKTPYLGAYLEMRLRAAFPQFPREILVVPPPRELDPAVLVWKGGSVFGKLRMTNDSWIGRLEYDRLGSRILNYKCIWHW
ncbi:Actin-like protein arp8 [Recurvomyces mirabilis]|uniref:Actin-like protein arp8 n=1 Tax=Recurvomyces mirabilis TaxID=574656 RepID=A0AAE1C5X7_9PEZI|nr:Actin-like protein arp8 [Recurvomyces mirabilis]KAK5158816.1 actin-like protein arp8 [Recurvomyces mirabilis]